MPLLGGNKNNKETSDVGTGGCRVQAEELEAAEHLVLCDLGVAVDVEGLEGAVHRVQRRAPQGAPGVDGGQQLVERLHFGVDLGNRLQGAADLDLGRACKLRGCPEDMRGAGGIGAGEEL